jgi:hypothetical protein
MQLLLPASQPACFYSSGMESLGCYRVHMLLCSCSYLSALSCRPGCPLSPSALQAQQALSVALNKLGELHHLQGDLPAAGGLYAQALQLRRSLLAATQAQWPPGGQQQQSAAGPPAEHAELEAGEAGEACCSAALDLAASCIKLAGARRELDAEGPEAPVSSHVCLGESAGCLCAASHLLLV